MEPRDICEVEMCKINDTSLCVLTGIEMRVIHYTTAVQFPVVIQILMQFHWQGNNKHKVKLGVVSWELLSFLSGFQCFYFCFSAQNEIYITRWIQTGKILATA